MTVGGRHEIGHQVAGVYNHLSCLEKYPISQREAYFQGDSLDSLLARCCDLSFSKSSTRTPSRIQIEHLGRRIHREVRRVFPRSGTLEMQCYQNDPAQTYTSYRPALPHGLLNSAKDQSFGKRNRFLLTLEFTLLAKLAGSSGRYFPSGGAADSNLLASPSYQPIRPNQNKHA